MPFRTFTRKLTTLHVQGGKMTFSSPLSDDVFHLLPGLGDGAYDLYGTVAHVPGYGPRIVSISIEFLTQEELGWMERELEEASLQQLY